MVQATSEFCSVGDGFLAGGGLFGGVIGTAEIFFRRTGNDGGGPAGWSCGNGIRISGHFSPLVPVEIPRQWPAWLACGQSSYHPGKLATLGAQDGFSRGNA